jgi:hypothetical protein
LPFVVQSGVPQESVLGPLLFNIFINGLCDIINHASCLHFADDLQVYQAISSPSDCLVLQSDIGCVHKWRSAKFLKPNFSKIKLISFIRKTNVLNYHYRLGTSLYSEQTVLRIWLYILIVNFLFIVMSILFFHVQ